MQCRYHIWKSDIEFFQQPWFILDRHIRGNLPRSYKQFTTFEEVRQFCLRGEWN